MPLSERGLSSYSRSSVEGALHFHFRRGKIPQRDATVRKRKGQVDVLLRRVIMVIRRNQFFRSAPSLTFRTIIFFDYVNARVDRKWSIGNQLFGDFSGQQNAWMRPNWQIH